MRAKIEALETGADADVTALQSESFNAANESMKGGGGRKGAYYKSLRLSFHYIHI